MKGLGVKIGDSIKVRKNDKFSYLKVAIDNLIPKNAISIREADLAKLGASEMDKLTVTRVTPAKELAKERIKKAKARAKKVKAGVKKRVGKAKKRLKKVKKKLKKEK